MKFSADVQVMQDAIASVIKALPVRTTMPALEGIYMEVKDNTLLLRCSDLLLQKECTVNVEMEQEGSAVIPAKIFAEFIRKLPPQAAHFALTDNSVSIRCGKTRNRFQCIECEEFPAMRTSGEDNTLHISAEKLRAAILRVSFATGQDESRPALTGAYLEANENNLTMVATDSFQLALQNVILDIPCNPIKTIIPGKALHELGRMLEGETEAVQLVFTKTHLKLDMPGSGLVTRLIDGNYIDYRRILPQNSKIRMLVNKEDLFSCVDRAQLVAREGSNSIVLKLQDNYMSVSAQSGVGIFHEEIEIQLSGDELEIAFNPKYILNVLKGIDEENLYMEFMSAVNPCKVHGTQDDSYLYLIVPMRLY
ncbi:MAG: DNA polymerase III subunit beta [Clostridiales bacterium]|nr:DNA polymerase III subunit beta [Clostridiales bacterium]